MLRPPVNETLPLAVRLHYSLPVLSSEPASASPQPRTTPTFALQMWSGPWARVALPAVVMNDGFKRRAAAPVEPFEVGYRLVVRDGPEA